MASNWQKDNEQMLSPEFWSGMSEDEIMVWLYVPEAEELSFGDALRTAFNRDQNAAEKLLQSLQEGDVI